MTKAEERALEVYPRSEKYTSSQRLIINDLRDGFIQGYEQAEKDYSLTWEDIRAIVKIVLTRPALDDYPPSEEYCKSVLEEFNKTRK